MVQKKRVVVVCWKNKSDNPFEVFSSLKNFCLSYEGFNYNTISNYLSKGKIAYENPEVRIERKEVILKAKATSAPETQRAIVTVLRKVKIKEADDAINDLKFWLKKTPKERVAAVTKMILSSQANLQRMDKTKIVKRKQHI